LTLYLAVTGGKGGVGKTTVAVNVAVTMMLRNYKVLLVDADVDNPNDHLNLGVEIHVLKSISIFTPNINANKCVKCSECVRVCPENALLSMPGMFPVLFRDQCSGCRICQLICKYDAISNMDKILGYIFKGVYNRLDLIGAELNPGEARSPLLAKALIDYVKENSSIYDIVVIDTPPGVQNTVIQSIRIADLALVITEPTLLGLSTLRLSLNALDKLNIPRVIVINRSNISDSIKREIYDYAIKHGVHVAIEIPFSKVLIDSSIKSIPVTALTEDLPIIEIFRRLTDFIEQSLKLRSSE